MAKKRKKKHKKAIMNAPAGPITVAKLLQTFKNSWNAGNAPVSLQAYRAWTTRTGNKGDPSIEGELLFRCASVDFKEKNEERALRRLEEARRADPAGSNRYDRFKALCLAKNNRPRESLELFSQLGDDFHRFLLCEYLKFEKPLPAALFNDPAAARPEIAALYRDFLEADTGASNLENAALKNIGHAFRLFEKEEDPEPQLKLLLKKKGFETLAVHLLLIAYIAGKRIVKLRNTIKKYAHFLKEDYFRDMITALLLTLLNEGKYKEIAQLDGLLTETGIQVKGLERIRDESNFHRGLAAVAAQDFDTALYYFREIGENASAVLHNLALCNQRLQRYGQANEYWTRLLAREKKPARDHSPEAVRSYCTILNYIGRNFALEDEPGLAQEYFKKVLLFDKTDKQSLEALLAIAAKSGSHPDALSYAGRLYGIDPDNEEYLLKYLQELKHFDKTDMVISICKKAIKKFPKSKLLCEILVDGYTERAWQFRDKDSFESIRIIKDVEKYDIINAKLIFLQGYLQYKDGKKKAALGKFKQAARTAVNHMQQFQIGTALYELGLKKDAVRLLQKLAGCSCEWSKELYFEAIEYLAGQDDRENTAHLCDHGVKQGFWSIDIAGILFDNKKFQWARKYSARAVEKKNLSYEEKFLHLRILNETGSKGDILDYARRLQAEARAAGNPMEMELYRHIVEQVKSRGRFREP